MGLQDRDYYRDEEGTSPIQSVVVKLIILNGLVFLTQILFRKEDGTSPVTQLLAAHGDTLLRPLYWWQFLTAGFVHDDQRLNHILFNMVGLYFFGRRLEEKYGPREFLRFYLVAVVVGMVLWNARVLWLAQGIPPELREGHLRNIGVLGASGGVTAVTLLFCLLYPRATVLAAMLFPVPAWVIGVLILVNNLFGVAMPGQTGIAFDVHLVGAGLAVAYWYFGWNFSRLPGTDELGRLFAGPAKWFKPRPRLQVHDPEQYYEDLDAEADRILVKLKEEGQDSLTPDERQLLEDYSRRMRQKLR
jgi:membrane associated rhomboid family serine protease